MNLQWELTVMLSGRSKARAMNFADVSFVHEVREAIGDARGLARLHEILVNMFGF